jgi:predicted RNase H-like nuclease (RuvC/YqgF family)
MIKCEFCDSVLSSMASLKHHQQKAKYCLEKRKIETNIYNCSSCSASFTTKRRLNTHYDSCVKYNVEKISLELNQKIQNTKDEFKNKEDQFHEQLKAKDEQIKNLQDKLENLTSKETEKVCELQDKLQEIAMTAIEQKNEVISSMVKKYVKKQPRKKFDCSNVVYILTTPSLKKERRYILGKAKNLTNRLSTYNKTDEHEVVYYQDCGDEESMNALEPFVFKKLSEYREQANRERFILPDNSNIDLFINTINECFEFLK